VLLSLRQAQNLPPVVKQFKAQTFEKQAQILPKASLGRPKRRWQVNIRMDLREIRCKTMDWIHLDKDRNQWHALMNVEMNLRFP
jgi:hypothetical protein